MKTSKSLYKDYCINVKQLLAALWTSLLFLYIYGDYFELYVPEKISGLMNGQNMLNTPYKLLLATVCLTIPSLMIFLSLTLKPKWNRVLNIFSGFFLTLFTLLVGLSSLTEWKMFYVMLAFLESLITLTVVWKAWDWPKLT